MRKPRTIHYRPVFFTFPTTTPPIITITTTTTATTTATTTNINITTLRQAALSSQPIRHKSTMATPPPLTQPRTYDVIPSNTMQCNPN